MRDAHRAGVPRKPGAPRRLWIRYLGAGVLNTLFGYGAYGTLLAIGFIPSWAVVLGAICGAFFNFRTFGAVFGSRDPGLLPRFATVYVVYLACNLVLLRLMIAAGLNPLLGQAAAIAMLMPCSYLAMQRWVFVEAAA